MSESIIVPKTKRNLVHTEIVNADVHCEHGKTLGPYLIRSKIRYTLTLAELASESESYTVSVNEPQICVCPVNATILLLLQSHVQSKPAMRYVAIISAPAKDQRLKSLAILSPSAKISHLFLWYIKALSTVFFLLIVSPL